MLQPASNILVPHMQPQWPRGRHVASGVGGSWWQAGGATSCVAAYQPKGAANYTASKVNLVTPGTHNASDISAPAWNSTDGWIFGGGHALDCALVPASGQTVIVQFTGASGAIQAFIGHFLNNSTARLEIGFDSGSRLYAGCHFQRVGSVITSGNMCLAVGTDGYFNGVSEGLTDLLPFSGSPSATMLIGARRREDIGGVDNYATVNLQAVAIYSALQSPTTIAALAAAMAAL